jgi:hypothetical protein
MTFLVQMAGAYGISRNDGSQVCAPQKRSDYIRANPYVSAWAVQKDGDFYNEGEQNECTNGDGDERDDIENAIPLAAIEAALTPTVLATFDKIADSYKIDRRHDPADIWR